MKQFSISSHEFFEKLQRRAQKTRIKHKFQLVGLMIASLLQDTKNKSLYIKIAKQEKNHEKLLALAKSISENDKIRNKGGYFMAAIFEKQP